MVTKLKSIGKPIDIGFESCVVLDGDKTALEVTRVERKFESCVVLDGDKTQARRKAGGRKFESCVILAGDKNRPNAAACASRFEICAVSERPSQTLCKPPMRCRIEASHRR